MARIRTIKPEFFTSEEIVSMTPFARLFTSLWVKGSWKDASGSPSPFKMRYLPATTAT